MAKERKQYDDDDGRVICSMDVPGMPGYDRRVRREQRALRSRENPGDGLTAPERRRYIGYAVLAGLAVVGVFAVGGVLFILFCTKVWLR